jgi:hypothetical protein
MCVGSRPFSFVLSIAGDIGYRSEVRALGLLDLPMDLFLFFLFLPLKMRWAASVCVAQNQKADRKGRAPFFWPPRTEATCFGEDQQRAAHTRTHRHSSNMKSQPRGI